MENIIKHLLIGITLLYVLFLFKRFLTQNNIIEGLEPRKKDVDDTPAPISNRPDLIKGNTEEHNLNTKDHRAHYENIIIDMDENIGTAMLKHLGDHSVAIANDPMHPDSQKKMENLTRMSNFRTTLNENMKWLDKNKINLMPRPYFIISIITFIQKFLSIGMSAPLLIHWIRTNFTFFIKHFI